MKATLVAEGERLSSVVAGLAEHSVQRSGLGLG